MKKWILLIIALIVIVIIVGIIAHIKTSNVSYHVIKVEQGNIVEQVQAAGYITPQHSISVKSPIGGSVSKVYHDAGDFVKKDEPLVAIEPMPAPVDYATAKENVVEQQANLNAAKNDLNRYQHMIQIGLITKNYGDYIDAKQTYETAKAQLALANQKLSLVETGKATVWNRKIDNTIVAPVSGYLMKRNIDVGDFVDPISSQQTATILFTISDMKNMMFLGYVDEADSSKIHKNMPATVDIGAIPGLEVKGTLSKISLQSQQAGNASRAVDQASIFTHSPFTAGFQVEVTQLKTPKDVQLRDGYSATANIAVKSALNVPMIPERVLHFDGEKAYVLIPVGKEHKAYKKQPVKLGISNGMDVQVKDGLKVGDKVIDQPVDDNGND